LLTTIGVRLYIVHQPGAFAHRNVVLITVDALRADHLGCYGYKRNTSPFLDSLVKKDAVLFTQAVSHASYTPGSMAAIATGNYYAEHHLKGFGGLLNSQLPTLAEILQQNGYKTIFIGGNLFYRGLYDLGRGFDFCSAGEFSKRAVIQFAISELAGLKHKNFFMWLHYMGTHAPYLAPKGYLDIFLNDAFFDPKRNLPAVQSDITGYGVQGIPQHVYIDGMNNPDFYIAQYDAAIRFFDAQLKLFIGKLKDLGLYDNTIIIISADHGELLGEHGYYFGHGVFLYEPLLKVPLIIKASPSVKKENVQQPVGASVDIAPTILDMLGIKAGSSFDGCSLVPLISGGGKPSREFTIHDTTHEKTAIRTARWKLIRSETARSPAYELYNIQDDPQESVNLVDTEREVSESLRSVLDAYCKSKPVWVPQEPLEEASKKQLQALGYLQ
jgi:arylsulfatase A-like enzyme